MQVVLLLIKLLLGLGLSGARPAKRFLTMFPPQSGHDANSGHRVTIVAEKFWTSVTVQVLETDFKESFFLSVGKPRTILLPSSVEMTGSESSHLLSVTSVWPVSVLAAYCTQEGCQHSLLHDVDSWGSHYYPVTPDLHNLTVSQMVITTADREASVDVLLPEQVLHGDELHSKGSVLKLNLGKMQSVTLQSNHSLSGCVLYSTEAIGVLVGFTCRRCTGRESLHGFAQLRPVSRWSFDYVIPPLVNTGMTLGLLLAMSTFSSDLHVTTSAGSRDVELVGGQVRVIPVVTSDKMHISSDAPLQLIYFRHDSEQHSSALTSLLPVDDICRVPPLSDPSDMAEPQDRGFDSGDVESKRPDGAGETDVGRYLSTLTRASYPEACATASCEELHCGHKHDCYFKDEKPQCSLKSKVCSAWGDSFYSSFDGEDLVLLGNCNYTLVQTNCLGSNESLSLQINIARAFLKSTKLSSIHTVQINFQGFNISIVREEINYIRVNGQKRSLPFTFEDLQFFPSASSVVMVTSFGLTLHYDWLHHLQVEISHALYNVVCGLCAGVKGGASKSLASPLPWLVNSDSICYEDCKGTSCQVCPHHRRHWVNSIMCNVLRRTNGPFENCHQYVNPEPFIRSCVDGLCLSRNRYSACKILTAYANVCQRLGARVKDWRSITNCPKTCPKNSHHERCGSACPATCANPEASLNCRLPCVESCQCNSGYVLSDGKCVAQTNCGCVLDGTYYPSKKTFWVGEQCRKKCICQPHSKKVTCVDSQCADGEACTMLHGELACHRRGPGFCVAKGDPHITTYDGLGFDVHGNCSYLFTSYCPTRGTLDDFHIEVQNQMKDISNVSFRHVKVVLAGYSIELSYKWPDKIKINGLLLNLPIILNRGKVQLYQSGHTTTLETDFGVALTYTTDLLIVQIPKTFSGNLCGLCGNFNDNPEDDLMLEGDADMSEAVGRWKTNGGHDCVDDPLFTLACSPVDVAQYRGKDFCGRLLDKDGEFQSCHNVVDPMASFESCVYDLCHAEGKDLCQILSTYVVVCQEMGAIMDEWRSPNFCEPSCPTNGEYRLCSTERFDCVEGGLTTRRCKEGCFCKPGFFHNAEGCVPNSNCGCFNDGSYHLVAETFYPDEHCRQRCVCVGHNREQCPNQTCPPGTHCSIKDGHRGCHKYLPSKCSVVGGKHFMVYSGDSFNFEMGTCRYLLSEFCNKDGPTIELDQTLLNVRLRGLHLLLDAKNLDKVKIDGVLVGLPVQLEHISVVHSGSLIRVLIDTGMVVTFGGSDLIQVEIPEAGGKMCGLCGIRAGADQTFNVAKLASPWMRSPRGENCSALHPSPQCNSTMLDEAASDAMCGRLRSPGGAFRNCHDTVHPDPFFQNCVKDSCALNDDSLCSSLRQYSLVCQAAGVAVEAWRGTKCPPSCPDNSHHTMCVAACPESCSDTSDIPCQDTCSEGCECDSGYVRSGGLCVRPEGCGCVHEGHYHQAGEVFWTDGCYERCDCEAADKLACEAAACPEGHVCALNDTWGCVAKARPPNSHHETCGVRSCASHEWQVCIYGGHRFVTFDRRRYDLRNTCQYLGVCELWRDLDVRLKDVVVRLDSRVSDEVNGVKRNLPCYLNQSVLVFSLDLHTYVYADFGFRLGIRACGRIPAANGAFRLCHGKLDPSGFYRRCVGDLCLHGGHRTLCEYTAHCLALEAAVLPWRRPDFCGVTCSASSRSSINSTSAHLCVGWKNNNSLDLPVASSEICVCEAGPAQDCGCVHQGASTCDRSCTCHEDRWSVGGVEACRPKPRASDCTVHGSQCTTFDGQMFHFHGSCNYTLLHTCLLDGSPGGRVHVSVQGNHSSGRRVSVNMSGLTVQISSQFPALVQVNGVLENLPFSRPDLSVNRENDRTILKFPTVEITSDLLRHIRVRLSSRFAGTTCGLCGYYNQDPSDDTKTPNGSVVVDPEVSREVCPENSHFLSCGSACPPTCERHESPCSKVCTEGCFCDAGFIKSPQGCVEPQRCGCTDSTGNYHRLNSTFWTPDRCGQVCVCTGPGAVHCRPSRCRGGTLCATEGPERVCRPQASVNCTLVSGLHFTTFDGRRFDFGDTCSFSLVRTSSVLDGLQPFNVSVSDSSCHKTLFHSRTVTLNVFGLELEVRKEDPGKLWVDGKHVSLPFSSHDKHINVFHTPSALQLLTDEGLQLRVSRWGDLTVLMPRSHRWSVAGLCGNANGDPGDDLLMPDRQPALDAQEFGHSWRLRTCRSTCSSRTRRCPLEARSRFEGSDFCGVLVDPLGPLADCASALDPEPFFRSCVVDSCAHGGHFTAVCHSIATYVAACQSSQLPVRAWRRDTFCGLSCPVNSHYELCGPRCPVTCDLSSPEVCGGGVCEEGCHCDLGFALSDGRCVAASDCRPSAANPVPGGLPRPRGSGVCEVFSGLGYVTFDGSVLPLHGACTYLLSSLAATTLLDHTLLATFDSRSAISRLDFSFLSTEMKVDPRILWKIQVNGEDRMVPFDDGFVMANLDGHKLTVASPSGVRLVLSSTHYLRLVLPPDLDHNAEASGLCGDFNGDGSDDLVTPVGRLAGSFGEFLHSWAVPGQHCPDTCDHTCGDCTVSPVASLACDILMITSVDFNPCWTRGVEPQIYKDVCQRLVCSGATHMEAVCLALEAYAAACQERGVTIRSWRKDTSCELQCPDHSSPSECVESGSDSCPSLLQLGSPTGCSPGCRCDAGNVFEGDQCVSYGRCGCMYRGHYIQAGGELYTPDCARRCWCHPRGGVICEPGLCDPGRPCALTNGSWGCREPRRCRLTGRLDVVTLTGQRLTLNPGVTYDLMSACDRAGERWFAVDLFTGPEWTVVNVRLPGSTLEVGGGRVKVDGLDASLPQTLPSGVTVSAGVAPDKSEVLVLLRRGSELQMDVGVTTATLGVSSWYSGRLRGLCGNLDDEAPVSVPSWVLQSPGGCGA